MEFAPTHPKFHDNDSQPLPFYAASINADKAALTGESGSYAA
jgi:hypothetical protein